jgi:hypothetical protein
MKTMMLSALIVAIGIGLLGCAQSDAPGAPPDKSMPVEEWGSPLPDWSEQPGRSRNGRIGQ